MKNFVTEILNLESYTWRHWAVLFFSFILVHFYFVIHAEYSNLAVFQAEAFLKGNLHIAEYFWDVAVYKNQYYVTYPPFPALLLLPSVAIWGNKVNTIFVSLLITCVSIYILYHLLQRYVGNAPIKKWLLAAFFLGSPYWFALLTSDFIYAFAHIVCTALLLLLLYELTGKQRFGLIALYWSMAFMTRQMTIFYGIVILYYIIHNHKEDAFKRLVFIATIFIAITGCYLVLNYMRFDSFLETGYSYLNYSGIIKVRVEQDGLFSHQYFLTNFYHMFLKGHNLLFTGDKLLKPGGID
ncbi:MAG: glycosyltransferase family 39 protein, partial [Cyclobacteriaceae bacterium]|nr:glycosyltransferase family 39 protein [Cyclobacteriaceae bacterium]